MFKKSVLILFVMILPNVCWAESNDTKTIELNVVQVIQLAGNFVEQGKFETAQDILNHVPQTGNLALETERWFLLAQIASRTGDIDNAIQIYRKILNDQPDLARVRFELAVCYMHQHKWRRADYHLRLAMAGKDLPDNVRQLMNYYRWVIRQNKNWNVWFNFGAAPDNNVNNSIGGEECVMTMFGLMCRNLAEPEKAIGANLTLGGNYEFKLSDRKPYDQLYASHPYQRRAITGANHTSPRVQTYRGPVDADTYKSS